MNIIVIGDADITSATCALKISTKQCPNPFEIYRCNQFGLKNDPATFQRQVDVTTLVNLNNFIVTSSSFSKNVSDLYLQHK